MQITAPDGLRLGKDFVSGTEIDEIPGAFYSGFGTNDEYAVIPNPLPGTYTIKTVGTDSGGPYTIVVNYADSATSSETQTEGITTVGQIISNTLTLSSTGAVVVAPDAPTPPPEALTPDTCVADMTKAYQNKWIGKKAVYAQLVADCKELKAILERPGPGSKQWEPTLRQRIERVLDDMDRLARDRSNTKDAVLLIHKYTTWFREQIHTQPSGTSF